jgi:hypothetical protein
MVKVSIWAPFGKPDGVQSEAGGVHCGLRRNPVNFHCDISSIA